MTSVEPESTVQLLLGRSPIIGHQESPQSEWQIYLFGDPRIEFKGEPTVPLATRKVAQLLVTIAAQPKRVHFRDSLAEAMWPNEPIEIARDRFRQTLYRLIQHFRKAGKTCPITASRTSVEIAKCDIDLTDFESAMLKSTSQTSNADQSNAFLFAAKLAHLPFADGMVEDWVRDIREGITSAITKSSQRISEQWIGSEEFRSALEVADAGLRMSPLDETLNLAKVRATHELGQVGEAARLAKSYEQRLSQALGLRPSAVWNEITANLTDPVAIDSGPTNQLWISIERPIDSFHGREMELAHLQTVLGSQSQHRLVTVTGPGGTGKTRLVSEYLSKSTGLDFSKIIVIGLADLESTVQFVSTLAKTLGVMVPGDSSAGAALASFIEPGTLLVLDNCEPLIPEISGFLKSLITSSQSLKVLATSRIKLGIHGEQELALMPLPISANFDPESQQSSPAVHLLIDRIRSFDHQFNPNPEERIEVQKLASLLDGIPLAIELAASKIPGVSVQELRIILEERVVELSNKNLDLPTRHLTLSETLRWGFEYLTEPAQELVTRLTIFPGSWTIDDAKVITEIPSDIDLHDELRRVGMIRIEQGSSPRRFHMPPIVRQFCQEKLPVQDREALSVNHFYHCLSKFRVFVDAEISNAKRIILFQQDLANVRFAVQTCLRFPALHSHAKSLYASTWTGFEAAGLSGEISQFLKRIIESEHISEDLRYQFFASYAQAISFYQNHPEIDSTIERVLELIPLSDIPNTRDFMVGNIAMMIYSNDRLEHGETMLQLIIKSDDGESNGKARLHLLLSKCQLLCLLDRNDEAKTLAESLIAWARKLDSEREIAYMTALYGHICLALECPEQAIPYFQSFIGVPYLQENFIGANFVIKMLMVVTIVQEHDQSAARQCALLLGYDRMFMRKYSHKLSNLVNEQVRVAHQQLSRELGDDFAELLLQGEKLLNSEAIEIARQLLFPE